MSIGAQIPTKIPCNSLPEKKRYSAITIIKLQSTKRSMFVIPNFLIKFIASFFLLTKIQKKVSIHNQLKNNRLSLSIFVKKMLKAVLFDMDGVIVNTEPLHKKAYFNMFEDIGLDISERLYQSYTGKSTMDTCIALCKNFDLQHKPKKLVSIKQSYFKTLFKEDQELKLISGVKSLIKNYYNNGLTLVLASSASMHTIDNVFDRFDLNPYFIKKISGADLKESKPNPEIFLKAAAAAGCDKKECFVIEDSTNGIIAAKKAGIFCVAFKSPNSKNQVYDEADLLIDNYSKIEYQRLKKLIS
jgi:HAD superfamily hydrolase (TIGR01509 family)